MAKLRDLYSDEEWERLGAESDALSEEERRAKIQEAFDGLKNANWSQSLDFSAFRNIGAPALDVDDLPEIESPFPEIVDVLQVLAAEQKKTTGELARANKAAKVAGRISFLTLIIAALALLTNLQPVQDWIARFL